jgi:hypothetical protein
MTAQASRVSWATMGIISFVTGWIKTAIGYIGAFFTGFFIGKLDEKNDQLEEELDDAVEKLKAWQGRAKTQNEFSDRLRARAKDKNV